MSAKANELIEVNHQPLTPMAMLDRALANNAGMDVLEKFMAMQERWDANQARKAFDEAVASAKAKIPPIARNREGHNKKKYADFAAIASTVDPVLSEFGLSYRFRTKQDNNVIHVTCVLSHKAGHSEETTLAGPADVSGNKNAIQAIGSTLTYLQRYSLVQMLGLAAAEDDDGKSVSASEPTITKEQVLELDTLIEEVGADKKGFLKFIKVERLEDILAAKFDAAKGLIEARRKK